MSDSEDDFMSDKFLVEAPKKAETSYSARRSKAQLQSQRLGQSKNLQTLKALEEERRREGLSQSLFEKKKEEGGVGASGNKAMEMMMKMGWKVGEGLGRSTAEEADSSASGSKRKRGGIGMRGKDSDDEEEDKEAPRGGLGSSSRSTTTAAKAPGKAARIEPIRISLWSGRKGLSARSPTPPPLPSQRNPDALDPKKLERLGQVTESFRERQKAEFGMKEVEKREWKARELLMQFDEEKGVKFHPLHVMPSDPLGTLPRPLLRRIYPAQVYSPSPSPPTAGDRQRSPSPPTLSETTHLAGTTISAAERLREQMRRDMLSELGGDDESSVRFGVIKDEVKESAKAGREDQAEKELEGADVDWEAMVSGTKKVLAMDSNTHLTFLLSQLRHEHLFCFWCAYKYKSYEEMDGPGGCPGEEEDDH